MRTRSQSREQRPPPPEGPPVVIEPLRIEYPFQEDPTVEPMADTRNCAQLLQAPTEGFIESPPAGGNFRTKCLVYVLNSSESKIPKVSFKHDAKAVVVGQGIVLKLFTSCFTDVAEHKDIVLSIALRQEEPSFCLSPDMPSSSSKVLCYLRWCPFHPKAVRLLMATFIGDIPFSEEDLKGITYPKLVLHIKEPTNSYFSVEKPIPRGDKDQGHLLVHKYAPRPNFLLGMDDMHSISLGSPVLALSNAIFSLGKALLHDLNTNLHDTRWVRID
ncbi:hypothetical protein Tco_1218246 [Tanacetum coccineum]